MNVNVKYRLSAAGQRAALLAGRTASATVTESLPLLDPAKIDQITVDSTGSPQYDASPSYSPSTWEVPSRYLELYEPPDSADEVIAAVFVLRVKQEAQLIDVRAKKAAEEEQERLEQEAAMLRDRSAKS